MRLLYLLVKITWLLTFLLFVGVFLYEVFAPCGIESMKRDIDLWLHECHTPK